MQYGECYPLSFPEQVISEIPIKERHELLRRTFHAEMSDKSTEVKLPRSVE